VGRVIKKLKFQGLSILLAEQNFAFALGIADQVYILHKGVVVFKGDSEELERNREIQDQYLAI
jgi:branched-chain amino acid transport system ATP-binding protein